MKHIGRKSLIIGKYLGKLIHNDNDQTSEIRSRIEIARNAFSKINNCPYCFDINVDFRIWMLKYFPHDCTVSKLGKYTVGTYLKYVSI